MTAARPFDVLLTLPLYSAACELAVPRVRTALETARRVSLQEIWDAYATGALGSMDWHEVCLVPPWRQWYGEYHAAAPMADGRTSYWGMLVQTADLWPAKRPMPHPLNWLLTSLIDDQEACGALPREHAVRARQALSAAGTATFDLGSPGAARSTAYLGQAVQGARFVMHATVMTCPARQNLLLAGSLHVVGEIVLALDERGYLICDEHGAPRLLTIRPDATRWYGLRTARDYLGAVVSHAESDRRSETVLAGEIGSVLGHMHALIHGTGIHELTEVIPTRQSRRAAARAGQLPLVSFGVLHIGAGRTRTEHERYTVRAGFLGLSRRAAHLRRAHLKAYTRKRGLFGRDLFGVFLWNESRAGRASRVHGKDYRIGLPGQGRHAPHPHENT